MQLRHSRRLKCGWFWRGRNVRHCRWLNDVPLSLNFKTLKDTLTQILHLGGGRRRKSRNTEVRRRRHTGTGRCGCERWLNRCCLLDVVQQNGLAGGRVGNHRRVAAIQARVSIRCAAEPISGLHRRKARFGLLQFAGEVSRDGRNRDWPGQRQSIHRVARAEGNDGENLRRGKPAWKVSRRRGGPSPVSKSKPGAPPAVLGPLNGSSRHRIAFRRPGFCPEGRTSILSSFPPMWEILRKKLQKTCTFLHKDETSMAGNAG